MRELPEKCLIYKASRRAYIGNYFLVALVIFFFLLLIQRISLNFNLFPKTLDQILLTYTALGFLVVIGFLIEEPVLEAWMKHYLVTNNEVVKVEGILRKKKMAIPYQSVADVRVKKGIVGRIFNYGNVEVAGMKENILMKSISNPEEIQRIIQNKINMFRSTVIKRKSIKKSEEEIGEEE